MAEVREQTGTDHSRFALLLSWDHLYHFCALLFLALYLLHPTSFVFCLLAWPLSLPLCLFPFLCRLVLLLSLVSPLSPVPFISSLTHVCPSHLVQKHALGPGSCLMFPLGLSSALHPLLPSVPFLLDPSYQSLQWR